METCKTKLQVELGPVPKLEINDWVEGELETNSDFGITGESEIQVQNQEEAQQLLVKDYQWTGYRNRREIRELSRYRDFVSLTVSSYQDLAFNGPKSYDEAASSKKSKSKNWYSAIEEEMNSLMKN